MHYCLDLSIWDIKKVWCVKALISFPIPQSFVYSPNKLYYNIPKLRKNMNCYNHDLLLYLHCDIWCKVKFEVRLLFEWWRYSKNFFLHVVVECDTKCCNFLSKLEIMKLVAGIAFVFYFCAKAKMIGNPVFIKWLWEIEWFPLLM